MIDEFADRLRQERKRLALNQAAFGKLGGVTLATQSRYELGASLPDAQYLKAIAAAGVDVQYVLTGARVVGEYLRSDEARLLHNYREVPAQARVAFDYLIASYGGSSRAIPPFTILPNEDALARMFRAMLLPLNLGDALEDTARTFAQQLPASLETAAPAHQPPGRGEAPDRDAPVPAPATGRPASGPEPRT